MPCRIESEPKEATMSKAVEAYRKAAVKLWPGYTPEQAAKGIVEPEDGNGWAPHSLAVIFMEGQTPMNYWAGGMEQGFKLAALAGIGYIEFVNPAVAAVYEC
jgi:hypothetical protein